MADPATLQEWFQINPNHKVELSPSPAFNRRVRAVFRGGEGIDRRIVGDGDNELQAIEHALENRARIRAELP